MNSFSRISFLAMAALAGAVVACGSTPSVQSSGSNLDSNGGSGDDPPMCGGPLDQKCPSGYTCGKGSSAESDLPRKCVKTPAPSAKGGPCGGSEDIGCASGLECQSGKDGSGTCEPPPPPDPGTEGGACSKSVKCDRWLACDPKTSKCVKIPAGELNGQCYGPGGKPIRCKGDLKCSYHIVGAPEPFFAPFGTCVTELPKAGDSCSTSDDCGELNCNHGTCN